MTNRDGMLQGHALCDLDQFRTAVRAHIGALSVTSANPQKFTAQLRHVKYGLLDFVKLNCDSLLVERTPHNIAADRGFDFLLALQLEGVGKTQQIGREVTLQPGDFTILDSTMPYSLEFDAPVKRMVVRLPRTELKRRGGISQTLCCRAFRGTVGVGAIASNMMISMEQNANEVASVLKQSLASTILDLILFSEAEGMGTGSELSTSSGATLQRLRAIVLANINDPDLTAERVAELAGISVRYVHKIFSTTGTSLSRWMQEERLIACHRCLVNEAHSHRSITDIAVSNGFSTSGYFSHLFSRRFGQSPSALRRQVQATRLSSMH